MRTATSLLTEYLHNNDKFTMMDLYTITLTNGTVIRYTNAPVNLTVDGNSFKSFTIKRGGLKHSIGFSVDSLSVEIFTNSNDSISEIISNNLNLPQSIIAGVFDGATLLLKRAYYDNPTLANFSTTYKGVINLFYGNISVEEVTKTNIKLEVNAITEIFDRKIPKCLFQGNCTSTVYSSACGANKGTATVTGVIDEVSTKQVLNTNIAHSSDFFTNGTITFTTGNNSLITRTVKKYVGGVFTLAKSLPHTPVIGDEFNCVAGCNKTASICQDKFNNSANFRGFPFIPKPETLL